MLHAFLKELLDLAQAALSAYLTAGGDKPLGHLYKAQQTANKTGNSQTCEKVSDDRYLGC